MNFCGRFTALYYQSGTDCGAAYSRPVLNKVQVHLQHIHAVP